MLLRKHGGDAQEKEVAPRHKRVGRRAGRLFLVHHDGRVGERVVAQLGNKGNVHALEAHTSFLGNLFSQFHFEGVLLPVHET